MLGPCSPHPNAETTCAQSQNVTLTESETQSPPLTRAAWIGSRRNRKKSTQEGAYVNRHLHLLGWGRCRRVARAFYLLRIVVRKQVARIAVCRGLPRRPAHPRAALDCRGEFRPRGTRPGADDHRPRWLVEPVDSPLDRRIQRGNSDPWGYLVQFRPVATWIGCYEISNNRDGPAVDHVFTAMYGSCPIRNQERHEVRNFLRPCGTAYRDAAQRLHQELPRALVIGG
jgi:hypothetical protein